MKLFYGSLIILFTLSHYSCEKHPWKPFDEILTTPEVSSSEPVLINNVKIEIEGIITGELSLVKKFGHCWSISNEPTINDDTTCFQTITTPFKSTIQNIGCVTKIYIKPYVIDKNADVRYGEVKVFEFEKDKWYKIPLNPLFTPREGAIGVAVNDKFYIGTGFNKQGNIEAPLKDFWEYDPIINNWKRLPDFPGNARGFAASFAIDKKIYVGTGISNIISNDRTEVFDDFYAYDIDNNSWSKIDSFPGKKRASALGISVNKKGYVICGQSNDGLLNEVWEYDPLSSTKWKPKKNFNDFRYSMRGFVINETLYAGTGENGGAPSDMYRYEPTNDNWIGIKPLGTRDRSSFFTFSLQGNGYLGGGTNSFPPDIIFYSEVYKYDPTSDTYTNVAPIPIAQYGSVGLSCNAVGYVIGGGKYGNDRGSEYWDSTNEIWKYIPR